MRAWGDTKRPKSCCRIAGSFPQRILHRAPKTFLVEIVPMKTPVRRPWPQKPSARSLALAALCLPLAAAEANLLSNGSFEGPTSGGHRPSSKSSMVYVPDDPHWTFLAGAGLQLAAEKDVHFYVPGNVAADGAWVAFLQNERSRLSQAFTAPSDGTYRVNYAVAGRDQDPPVGGDLTYEVRIDGVAIAKESTASHQRWTPRSHEFRTRAGTHVLEFAYVYPPRFLNGRAYDETFFIDRVSVNSREAAGVESGTQAGGVGKGNAGRSSKDVAEAAASTTAGASSAPPPRSALGKATPPPGGSSPDRIADPSNGMDGVPSRTTATASTQGHASSPSPARPSGSRGFLILLTVLFSGLLLVLLVAIARAFRGGRDRE